MKTFWDRHDATARRGRITQASAIILAAKLPMLAGYHPKANDIKYTVETAIELEKEVTKQIEEETT